MSRIYELEGNLHKVKNSLGETTHLRPFVGTFHGVKFTIKKH